MMQFGGGLKPLNVKVDYIGGAGDTMMLREEPVYCEYCDEKVEPEAKEMKKVVVNGRNRRLRFYKCYNCGNTFSERDHKHPINK